MAQLEIIYGDGSTDLVVSDGTWRSSTGPIISSDLFDGEVYDARLERPGWSKAGFDDKGWGRVKSAPFDPAVLAAPIGVPVRKITELRPQEILKTPSGETVADFGQNMVGWVRLSAKGRRGTEITLRHGEVLDRSGNFYNKNYRTAKATNKYILRGAEDGEVFEPHFTFTGFRYAKVEGYPGSPARDDLTGCVIHSDLEQTARFRCSHDGVNRLFENILWSQKGNFLDVPTDCPQRDERMGWTGDLLVYGPSACQMMNSAPFLSRWLRDVKIGQEESGRVPLVIPDPCADKKEFAKRAIKLTGGLKGAISNVGGLITLMELSDSAAWGDTAIFVPWYMYLYYGDRRILEANYDSMRALFAFRTRRARKFGSFIYVHPRSWFDTGTWKHLPDYYTASWHWGDWLAPGDGVYKSIFKSKIYIPTVFHAMDALLLSRTAAVLDKKEDAAYYRERYEDIRRAYRHILGRKNGRVCPNRQSAYTLALAAELLPEESRRETAHILADMVRKNGNRIGTGILGTAFICRVLSEYGFEDAAYDLLLQEERPSWLYQVKRGATTIWEHWDAIRENGSFKSWRMLSFNNYAFGAIGAWLLGSVAGINPDETQPGYKHVIIRPRIDRRLSFARASYESIHGLMESGWELSGNTLILEVRIPANATAEVFIPEDFSAEVSESGRPVECEGGPIQIGSGNYEFHCVSREADRHWVDE